eukprot:jgi/Ulvmu1/7731/UM039_0037.1
MGGKAPVLLAAVGLLLASTPTALADVPAVGPAPVATAAAPTAAPVAAAIVPIATVAPPTAAAPEEADPPPAPSSGGSPEWPKCDWFSGNESHTLVGIMETEFTRRFGAADFSALMARVDAPTMAILTEFDLSKPGHTLMAPLTEGKNFTDKKLRDVNTFQNFNLDPATISTEAATYIVRNHLINETITYSRLQQITELGNTATYQSLGDAVWEFTFASGGIKLVDRYGATEDRTKGLIFIQADISNAKQGECPNTVFSVDGFIAIPAFIPAPPPPPPPPTPPPQPVVRSQPAGFTNPFADPAPDTTASPATPAAPAESAPVVDDSAAAPWRGVCVALAAAAATAMLATS